MAHDKVYGYCENLCKVEVLPKESSMTADSFVVETYSEHSATRVDDIGTNASFNISKSGYKPIGIVGFYVNHAEVYVRACYLSNVQEGSAKINYYMRTAESGMVVSSVTQTTRVLWVKI